MMMPPSQTAQSEAGPSRLTPVIVKQELDVPGSNERHPVLKLHASPKKRFDKVAAIVESKKRESMQERLQKHITVAQERLVAIQKEEEEQKRLMDASKGKGKRKAERQAETAKFNDLILE
jgi:hypothetical protein